MNFDWREVKEMFYTIGTVAGVIALARPVFESKYQRDIARFDRIRSLIEEESIVDLEDRVYGARQVPDGYFTPFDRLSRARKNDEDIVRFSGPLAKLFTSQIDALINAYEGLRAYIQVPEWEPCGHMLSNGTKYFSWDFNKEAFAKAGSYPTGYAGHLDAARSKAVEIKKAYQRLQLVAEVHLYEAPIANWLLCRRFKKLGL